MVIDPGWQEIIIGCERDNINFYAQEIGFFKKLLEKQEDEQIRQWFNYFIVYSESEMEIANGKLTALRKELDDFEHDAG
jgi:polyhydroxyalkanoate synthesis regulator phasin